jgi:histidinol-phosphatase (PHP family)
MPDVMIRLFLHLLYMSWANYHSHSLFCDGKAAPEDFIIAAIAKGFCAYGFSSHAHVPFPSHWNMDISRLDEYLNEVLRLRSAYAGKIEIYTGLEVDYIDGQWGFGSSGLKDKKLDYVIGSVHYIGCLPDGSFFFFDGQPDAFFRGIEILYQNDYRKALTGYYHSVRSMIEQERPDIVGHLDKIKMHNTVRPYFNEGEKWYKEQVEETLGLIAQNGCILEVNTRGYIKQNPPMLYPGKWVLERAFQYNIPVMLNSDAHHPEEIDAGFSNAAAILKDIGYESLRVLLDGRWQDMPFNENGLLN